MSLQDNAGTIAKLHSLGFETKNSHRNNRADYSYILIPANKWHLVFNVEFNFSGRSKQVSKLNFLNATVNGQEITKKRARELMKSKISFGCQAGNWNGDSEILKLMRWTPEQVEDFHLTKDSTVRLQDMPEEKASAVFRSVRLGLENIGLMAALTIDKPADLQTFKSEFSDLLMYADIYGEDATETEMNKGFATAQGSLLTLNAVKQLGKQGIDAIGKLAVVSLDYREDAQRFKTDLGGLLLKWNLLDEHAIESSDWLSVI